MTSQPDPAVEAVALLPYAFARRHAVAVRAGRSGAPDLVCAAAPTIEVLVEVQRRVGASLQPCIVGEADFQRLLQEIYQDRAGEAAEAAARADVDLSSLADSAAGVDDLLDSTGNSPVVQLINALLLQAVKEGASDIHIDTQERVLRVRFRVDGLLRDVLTPRRELGPYLVSRIKVMARLDISEKRLPQDGRVSLTVGGRDIDVRVSTVPAQHAERVVMRLLDRGASQHDLTSLGFSARDLAAFERMLARPNGIVLVTGPTGSGKTTTLYAALSRMNAPTLNIMTIEDPIEYAVRGVAQMQVDGRSGLTFARGLRAILRQDPNIIMVGEIRDGETAHIAVQASMTGHFVLSTLHTNSALSSVTRLLDMGIERFLLAPMLSGLIAQRLVRRLCPDCAKPVDASEADARATSGGLRPGERILQPVGCPVCRGEGYRGRIALYEVVEIDRELERLIHESASEAELVAAARMRGPSLLMDGVDKVRAGVTSLAEVIRVAVDD